MLGAREGLMQSDDAANSCFLVLEDEAHAKNSEGSGVSPRLCNSTCSRMANTGMPTNSVSMCMLQFQISNQYKHFNNIE